MELLKIQMREFKNIFIAYSPIHIVAAFSLSEKKTLLIMPKKFKNIINFMPKKILHYYLQIFQHLLTIFLKNFLH